MPMLRLLAPLLLCLVLGLVSAQASADVLRVISNDPDARQLSKQQIKQIYLSGGRLGLTPINYTPGNRLRTVFNASVMGLTEARISAYWAQMKFTGRAKPPQEYRDEQGIIEAMEQTPSLIAYLPDHVDIPEGYTVVLEITY